jgi:hypothetical protein
VLLYYDDGRFAPSGFIHLSCAPGYLETADLLGRLRHFSPDLGDADWAAIRAQLGQP